MAIYNVLTSFVGIIITYIILISCYKLLSNTNANVLNFKSVIVVILISIIAYFNNQYNFNIGRLIIHYFLVLVLFFKIFKISFIEGVVKSFLIYSTVCIFEIILGVVLILLNEKSFYNFENNITLKNAFSIIVMLFTLLLYEIKISRNCLRKILLRLTSDKEKILKIILLFSIIVIFIVMFKFTFNMTIKVYVTNLLIFAIFFSLIIIYVFQYLKTKKAEAKEEILLGFMSKYEKLLDNDRINKHEMLNNLLVLRSFKNKNSAQFEETINTIIKEYENKDSKIFTDLYNLPTGLKGLLYYKIYDMKNVNLNINLNISKKVFAFLESLEPKIFLKLCKILGIILDNAKEACELSLTKNIIIDIYKEKHSIVIYIENSIKENINIDKIYNKHYSTKGKNRGLGLYIVKETTKNTEEFEFEQFINENSNFVSILKIKTTT